MRTTTRYAGSSQFATKEATDRARQRVRQLLAKGMTRKTIATKAGIAASSVTKLCNDADPHISRATASRILAVKG